jgi:hypothetical protein
MPRSKNPQAHSNPGPKLGGSLRRYSEPTSRYNSLPLSDGGRMWLPRWR